MSTNTPVRRPKSRLPASKDTSIDADSMSDEPSYPLENRRDAEVARSTAAGGVILNGALATILSWGLTIGLIFGGCCSNVFALEAIVKDEPDSGLLITLVQFLTIFSLTLPSQLDLSKPGHILKRRVVPIAHWIPAIAMYFAVNMLNNWAFGFSISVPIHIILRSGGSVTTMIIGYLWGKKYNQGQILGVTMLTSGVIIAALSDAQSKGKMNTHSSGSMSSFIAGLLILFVAQIISAIMGLYIQNTYAKYGPQWHENLFYSHFLSLPLFAPIFPSLWRQFQKLLMSPPVVFNMPTGSWFYGAESEIHGWKSSLGQVWNSQNSTPSLQVKIPSQLINLAINALTQFACIRGVNLLATRTTALGVTIVLNLRKLVSLFLSIWLFGNRLPTGVSAGASIVFVGAAVYGWSGQSRQQKPEHQEVEKSKFG